MGLQKPSRSCQDSWVGSVFIQAMVVGPFQLLCGNMRASARIRVRAVRRTKPKAALRPWQEKDCQKQMGAAKIHGLEELYLCSSKAQMESKNYS